MKKTLSITIIFVAIAFIGIAQSTTQIKTAKLTYNSVGDFSVSLQLLLDIQSSEKVDPDFFLDKSKIPRFTLTYADNDANCPLTINPTVSQNSVGFKISGFNQKSIDLLKSSDNQLTITIKNDLELNILETSGDSILSSRTIILRKEDVNHAIRENLKITDEQHSNFVSALNNFYYYENLVDFGIVPKGDNEQSSYFLTLKLRNRYNNAGTIKCDANSKTLVSFWSLTSRVSTNFADSLNFINFYPINLISSIREDFPSQWRLKVGNESNQIFTNKRVIIDGSFYSILPNIINLTTASSNRLRLKPIIDFGVKAYYDYSSDIKHFSSGQAYAGGYYYIPIHTNYALIFEGKAFYDFSEQRNPGRKIMGNYSITLGAEIPKTGFKAMFKYVDGKTDIGFKEGQIIALGILMDFLQEKNRPK